MRTPTIIVSGGLGSGKTTFIKGIVAAHPDCRFGVIVNEFGEIGIDGDLLRPHIPEVIEIRNGCFCCVTQDQLVPAVKEILSKYAVDILLVEMSGVGEPASVIQQFSVLFPLVELRAHAVLADSTIDPDAATRDLGFCGALALGDIIVCTKSDIAPTSFVVRWKRFMSSFNARATVVSAVKGNLELASLMKSRRRASSFIAEEQPVGVASAPRHGFASVFQLVDLLSAKQLEQLMTKCGDRSVTARIKGIVQVDGVWTEVHSVRGALDVELFLGVPPARGRLVFISDSLSQGDLRRLIEESLPTPWDSPSMAAL